MRAHQDHTITMRRALLTLLVAMVTFTVATAATSSAGAATSKSDTPVGAFRRFEFEFELGITSGTDGPALTMATKGAYVGPKAQECEASVSFAPGIDIQLRAVVIGPSTWIDEGRGLKKARGRDFDWKDECPSSPTFWAEFPFDDLPRNLHGTTETRGGVAVEHLDLTEMVGLMGSFVDDFPSDVTAERVSVWRTKRDGVVVGVDIAMRGNSVDSCRELLESSSEDVAPSSCAMHVRLDVSRINDPDVKIKGGRGASGHVVKV